MRVVVGSTNPTKIEPVKNVFSKHFNNVEVVSVKVESGVRDQPMEDAEAFRGALRRAQEALAQVPDADYGVGIEGGLHQYDYGWLERSMVVITDKKGNVGIGSSGGVVLPNKVMDGIHSGKNLEEVMDGIFGTTKIGQGIGMFGLLTKGVVTRTSGVEHGVAFALARFLHPELYK